MSRPAGATVEVPIRAYLDRIAAGLHGPRGRRARILAELHDGLDQAVSDRTRDGQPCEKAVEAAIAQFGTPEAVTAAFAGELATAYARRSISAFILTGPLVGIWWLALLHPGPGRAGPVTLITAIPVIPLIGVALATAVGAIAATGRLMRWIPEASPGRALIATNTVAGLATTGDLIIIAVAARAGVLHSPLAVMAVAASLARCGLSLHIVGKTVAMRRRLRS